MEERKLMQEEIVLKGINGIVMLLVLILGMLGSIAVIVGCGVLIDYTMLGVPVLILGIVLLMVCTIMLAGLKIIKPNEALVLDRKSTRLNSSHTS